MYLGRSLAYTSGSIASNFTVISGYITIPICFRSLFTHSRSRLLCAGKKYKHTFFQKL